MQKVAPSLGRILVMVLFALSCFGLLLFLWLAFGGSMPLQAKGYRFTIPFREAGQLAQEADVRISGVAVGQASRRSTANPTTGRSDVDVEIDAEVRADAAATRASMLRAEDAARRDLRRAHAGRQAQSPAVPDGGTLPVGNVRRPSSSTRSSGRSTPARARRSDVWQQELAVASAGRGQDINDFFAQLRAARAGQATRLRASSTRTRATSAQLVSNTGKVFNALGARSDQLRGLIANTQPRLRDDRGAQPAARADVRRVADLRARVPAPACADRAVRRDARTR